MSEDQVVFKEMEYSHDQIIRVFTDMFKGREVLHIRRFWLDEEDEYRPSKGVTFRRENIDDILEGLQAMKTWCEEHPK